MPVPIDLKGDTWTYGCEHELADWDTFLKPPDGVLGRSNDHTVVNANGVAAQPNIKVYRYGGEINTVPGTMLEQIEWLENITEQYECSVNHRSNLHIHIRVPGLKSSLRMLKQVQKFIHDELPKVIDEIEPIPTAYTPAEKKRARRRKVSHHTFLTPSRVANQLKAKTIPEFFEREVPTDRNGNAMWHAQPRVCVNLRQLLQTDTVEFRHFPGTLNDSELETCLDWCHDFMECALNDAPLGPVCESMLGNIDRHNIGRFPTFTSFDEEREVRYQATAANNGLTLMERLNNIDSILKEKFSAKHTPAAYQKAQERAGVVPR